MDTAPAILKDPLGQVQFSTINYPPLVRRSERLTTKLPLLYGAEGTRVPIPVVSRPDAVEALRYEGSATSS